MLLTVNIDKKPMIPMIKAAADFFFDSPTSMFYTGRVMDILFDGIPINCNSEDFQVKAVCSVFQSGEVKAVRPLGGNHFAFSLLV